MAYIIWVWSTAQVKNAVADVAVTGKAIGTPRFTLCPSAKKTICTLGTMPAKQAFEMIVRTTIGPAATVGEQVTLTLLMQGGGLSPAEAAVAVLIGQSGTTPPPTSPGTTLSPITFPQVNGGTVAPTNLSSLFPVITPSTGQSASASTSPTVINARPVASTLPLDPRLIGGQLAGLAVLAVALTMVVARLSLRTPATAASAARSAASATAPTQTTGSTAKTEATPKTKAAPKTEATATEAS